MFAALFLTLTGCNDYSISERVELEDTDTDTDIAPPTPAPEPDAGAPVAVCSVSPNPVTPPFEAATFDGSGSYDPEGLDVVEYRWVLSEKPQGSAVEMPAGSGAIRNGFTPDLAGLYVGRLTVVNSAGVESDACEAELEAIPSQNLWVEMFWDAPGDDMDLHLLAPGGAPRTETDCYYSNCNESQGDFLDWGQANYIDDNPRLDLDDISGTGPENINITQPANLGGGYTVMVHDYPGSSDPASSNVTVNIYMNGALVWSDTRTVTGEDQDVYFAQIDWQAQTVTGL